MLTLLGLASCSKERGMDQAPDINGQSEIRFSLHSSLRATIEAVEISGSQGRIAALENEKKINTLEAFFFDSNNNFAKRFTPQQRGTEWVIKDHQLKGDTYKVFFVANAGTTLQGLLDGMNTATTVEDFKALVSDQDPGHAGMEGFLMISQQISQAIANEVDSKTLPEVKLTRASVRFDFVNEIKDLKIESITYNERFVQSQISTPAQNLPIPSATDTKEYNQLKVGKLGSQDIQTLIGEIYAYENLTNPQKFLIKATYGGKEVEDITVLIPTVAKRNYLYTVTLKESGIINPDDIKSGINVVFHVYDWNEGTEIIMTDDQLANQGSAISKKTYSLSLTAPSTGEVSIAAKPAAGYTIPYTVKSEVTTQAMLNGQPQGVASTTTAPYKVTVDAAWLSVDSNNKITAMENTALTERSAKVTIELTGEGADKATPVSFVVRQPGAMQTQSYAYTITITNPAAVNGKHTLSVGADATVAIFQVTAIETVTTMTNGVSTRVATNDVTDKIVSSTKVNWITATGKSLDIKANTTNSTRDAAVTVTLEGVQGTPTPVTLHVSQDKRAGNPNIVGATVLSNVAEYNLDFNGSFKTDTKNDANELMQWARANSFFTNDPSGLKVLKSDPKYYFPEKEHWLAIIPRYEVGFRNGDPRETTETVKIGTENVTGKADYRYQNGKTYAVRFKGTEYESAWLYEYVDNPAHTGTSHKMVKISAYPLAQNSGMNAFQIKDSDFDKATYSNVEVRIFPASGYRTPNRVLYLVGAHGVFWSSSPRSVLEIWHMNCVDAIVYYSSGDPESYLSVRPFVRN